ncbi:MAG: hypothetical protein NWF14_01045 [Candidatus Bathyarchaeota archaeon]|nr:hypothetical protein [Candidatus Bathyarchaeota archaeon]
MSKREVSDKQIKADLMHRLFRKHCWGARYLPVDTLVRWISSKVKRNGKRVSRLTRQLVNDGYLLLHKRGNAVSLNPARSEEILDFIRRFIV